MNLINKKFKNRKQFHDKQSLEIDHLKKLAHHDYETGVFNRYYMMNIMSEQHFSSSDTDKIMLLIDLLSLNSIEVYHGYEAKYKLVNTFIDILKSEIKDEAIIARMDNENFLVIWPNSDIEDLKSFLRRCTKLMIDINPYSLIITGPDNVLSYTYWNPLKNTVNKGYNECKLAAMYAKENSPYQLVKYDENMRYEFEEKSDLASRIESAIQNDEFEVWFQGKYNIEKEKIIGFEALSRWKDLKGDYISPAIFIPLISVSYSFIYFSKYILKKSIYEFEHILLKHNENLSLSLNISPKFFMSKDFIPYLNEVVFGSRVNPSQIILEITEDVFIGDYTDIIHRIRVLKDQGYLISLDDFGSGYSSFNHLCNMDIDEIKIDRSIVSKAISHEKNRHIIKMIVLLSIHMGWGVVAEGVETLEEVELLQIFGVKIIQGYYFSKPKPIKDL